MFYFQYIGREIFDPGYLFLKYRIDSESELAIILEERKIFCLEGVHFVFDSRYEHSQSPL